MNRAGAGRSLDFEPSKRFGEENQNQDPDTFLSIEIITIMTVSIVMIILVIVGIVYKVFVLSRIEKDDSVLDTNVNLNRVNRQISKDSVTSF